MELPEFDLHVLRFIGRSKTGRSQNELIDKYDIAVVACIGLLSEKKYVTEHTHLINPYLPESSKILEPPIRNIVITGPGKTVLQRQKFSHRRRAKDRAKDWIFGFISGLGVSVIAGLILQVV